MTFSFFLVYQALFPQSKCPLIDVWIKYLLLAHEILKHSNELVEKVDKMA